MQVDPEAAEWRFVEGEVVGLDLHAEEYFSIAGSGVPLWQRLVEGGTELELAELLTARYAVPDGRAAADVAAFLGTLRERGLIRP